MQTDLNIAVLQLNLTVGDTSGNSAKLAQAYHEAVASGADLVMAPELAISGYPPKDNLRHTAFIAACMAASRKLAACVGKVPFAFGTPWQAPRAGDYGQKAFNSYVVAHQGRIVFRTNKVYLAQGGVFDEWRVHKPGRDAKLWDYRGYRIGFPICEDIWHDRVVKALARKGANLLLVPNGSPSYVGKPQVRQQLVGRHVQATGIPMLYLNHVGGQDEHAFDGGAFFHNPGDKRATVFAPYWQEATRHVTVRNGKQGPRFSATTADLVEQLDDMDYMLNGIVLTTRDYLVKSSTIRKLVIGISGGVDSAVVLALAVMAVGAENVIAISLPSRHNTQTTKGFAQQVCDNLGVTLHWWDIAPSMEDFLARYASTFGHELKLPGNAAYENTQSRERGQILMAMSNRQHGLLLSTGNKSEMAMGYATLYGDMNGGFNPLKTVYKTQVYQLGYAINQALGHEAIPVTLITQRPSAELDDNQFDDNALPPYAVLDAILSRFMDEGQDPAAIVGSPPLTSLQECTVIHFPKADDPIWQQQNEDLSARKPMQRFMRRGPGRYKDEDDYFVHPDCVLAVIRQLLVFRFKRYQAPPGVTMTASSFDDGENYPIANHLGWLEHGLVAA